jgi:tripartite-type tricarboxylate transporter receptor subunit TctC
MRRNEVAERIERNNPMRRLITRTLAAGVIATVAVGASLPAAAQTPADFYKGRNVTIMLGHPPGGSYHMYATLAANHLKRHIPGNPNVILEHRPGGGGVRAARHFYSNAPRDGSVMALFPETMAHTEILQPEVGQWKMLEMTYIGNFSGVGAVMMRREHAPAKTIAEMRKVPSTVGCTGKTSQAYQTAAMMKNLGGFQFKIICGYPGSADYVLALQRGELDLASSAWLQWRTSHTGEIKKGTMVPVIQTGLRRNRELPDLPLLQEVIEDETSKRVIDFLSAATQFGRALLAPPGVPADRVAALRGAFDTLVKDPAFLKDAERAKAQIDPTSGADLQKDLVALFKAPKDIVDRADRAMD